jgi:ribonuclease D
VSAHPDPTTDPRSIADEAGLDRVLDALEAKRVIGFDTEFLWERTYLPKLAVVQVSARAPDGEVEAFAVDPLAVDVSPLLELLADGERTVVMHAGRLDQQIVHQLRGTPIERVFDTQKGASLLGHGAQIGYANLVLAVLGQKLKKGQQYTDWTRRPLRPAQLQYALMDVIPLLDVYEALRSGLDERGRLAWALEEMTELTDPTTYARTPVDEVYTTVKRWKNLEPRGLATLRELAAWREREAERRDWRPRHVVADPSLVDMATRRPRTLKALRAVRGLHAKEVDKGGKAILKCIERAEKLPEDQLPRVPKRKRGKDVSAAVDLLKALIAKRSEEVGVASEVLVTTAGLERLARDAQRERFKHDHPVLAGWRGELIGEDLLRLLRGEVTLGVDPESAELRLVEDGEGAEG